MKNDKGKATNQKKDLSNELWETTWTYVKTVVDTVREPFLVLDKNLQVVAANETFYQLFKVARADTESKYVYNIGNKQWNIPALKKLLEEIVPCDTFFKDFEGAIDIPYIQVKNKAGQYIISRREYLSFKAVLTIFPETDYYIILVHPGK